MSAESSIIESHVSEQLSELQSVVDAMPDRPADDSLAESRIEPPPQDAPRLDRFLVFAAIPSWITSMIVHVIALLLLALITFPLEVQRKETELTLRDSEVVDVDQEMPTFDLKDPELTKELSTELDVPDVISPETELIADEAIISDAHDLDSVAVHQEFSPLAIDTAVQSDVMATDGGTTGTGLTGRGEATRKRLIREAGGSAESERAVQLALQWLLRHQHPNGSWSFNHALGACPCRNHGTHDGALNGATAMALLPFLGAGHTHMEGKYQEKDQASPLLPAHASEVKRIVRGKHGNLYSHGLCAITLCEAYAMTKDPDLLRPAQASLNYIAFAQDPVGGGWRYAPKQPGDTSVVGWQLMALKSGKMAYLDVDDRVLLGAAKFLDSVQDDGGAAYGYASPGSRAATTSIGLLCRMYMGWDRETKALVRGVNRLSKSGPSDKDMYYNYYATQVMRHYEGDMWKKWNKKMRDFLVETQEQNGHMQGSWHMGASHAAKAGGRLYNTALATMVLEVYYRHMPIYRTQAVEEDFKL